MGLKKTALLCLSLVLALAITGCASPEQADLPAPSSQPVSSAPVSSAPASSAVSSKPESSSVPASSEAPASSEEQVSSEALVSQAAPASSEAPVSSEPPASQLAPASSKAPVSSEIPVSSEVPPPAASEPPASSEPESEPEPVPEKTAQIPLSPCGSDEGVVEKLLFDLVNGKRTELGLPALQWSDTYHHACHIRSTELPALFEHARPNGSTWYSVFPEVGLPAVEAGGTYRENLDSGRNAGTLGHEELAQALYDAWINSPLHYENIVATDETTSAICVVYDGYDVYATQEFGR